MTEVQQRTLAVYRDRQRHPTVASVAAELGIARQNLRERLLRIERNNLAKFYWRSDTSLKAAKWFAGVSNG